MKLTVIVLILLGLVAAFSVSVLIGTSRTPNFTRTNSSEEVEVVLTTASSPAMSVITSSYLTTDKVSKDNLPKGYLASPVRAVGRVLAIPVVEGQVLTESCFVREGTGAQLAAALPTGMRAITVTISRQSVTTGLLYPGCVVDVLASFKLPYQEKNKGEALSTTLLRGIQVLAVENTSVVSNDEDKTEEGPLGRSHSTSGRITVTLMVNPKQAEALQLAMVYGGIALTMRNPLDKSPVDLDATVLSQGRLARLGSALSPAVLAAEVEKHGLTTPVLSGTDSEEQTQADNMGSLLQQPILQEEKPDEAFSARRPAWLVTVIRGSQVEEQELDIRESETIARAEMEK